jgi:hypothetical protein
MYDIPNCGMVRKTTGIFHGIEMGYSWDISTFGVFEETIVFGIPNFQSHMILAPLDAYT